MKVVAIKPVFYGGFLYKDGEVFELSDSHKLNEKVMRKLEAGDEPATEPVKKGRGKKAGDEPATFSDMNKEDSRTHAEKEAENLLAK